MQSSSTLTVNLSAIHHNLNRFIHISGHVMVMVKANGYGTDQILLSKFIHSLASHKIPFLGVSHVWEGIELRQSGITLPIFVISVPPWEAEYAVTHSLTPAVSSEKEAEALNDQGQKQGKKIPVHLYLDTGMNRSGIASHQAMPLYSHISRASNLYVEGILTHFAAADSPAFDPFTYEQISQFKFFLDSLPLKPKWIHAANSGGAARFHLPFCNLARIGLGYVGYGPHLPGLESALSLKTQLVAIKPAKKGDTVGYNRLHTISQEETPIGVIPFGYFDGFPRSLSGKGYVLIRGKKAPMIGTICMDFMMIDLSGIPEACVGDEVTLFNTDLSAETVAAWAQTDVREILVNFPNRVKRLWTNTPLRTNNDDTTNPERFSNPLFTFEKSPPSRQHLLPT